MDFSAQYQYGAGQQAYPFMPMQPLTPSHSASAASDDFGNTSPPEASFEALADQFSGYDYNTQGLTPGTLNSTFPGPPTPPNQAAFGGQASAQQQQQHGQAFAGKADSQHQGSPPEDAQGAKANSEDDDSLTPAQSRRKAQNRAAQRAFRERKERHVKDLENKLASLEAAQQQASTENERLKRDLQKMATENEILRATSGMGGNGGNGAASHRSGSHASASPEDHSVTTGPTEYKPTDFYTNVLSDHANKIPSHRIVLGDDGERLFAAGATWDYIVQHELYKRGLVDVGSVSEMLKGSARCDGQGPVFPESAILSAIEQSVASGSDDLL